jgi:uncharacterized protein
MTITLLQARAMLLAAQGLLDAPSAPATRDDVLQTIRRMGVLQIDTIHVVARSPYLVLWSRLGAYPQRWLEELESAGRLFEYWAHAACFIPVEDYPLYRRVMVDGVRGWTNPDGWLSEHAEAVGLVMERIRQGGAVRSSDFDGAKAPGGWWNWKEEKMVLEVLLTRGDLMVRERKNFQRIYDLRERILTEWDDVKMPSAEVVQRAFLLKTALCLGVMRAGWAADYFRLKKTGIAGQLAALVKEGALLTDTVEGWTDPVYVHPEHRALLEQAQRGELAPGCTTLLSPFDPLVWDRKRARELFDFDYTIECYTPAAKRRYGYFTLPILQRGRLVGRLDPKAHRQLGKFEVRNIVLEPGIEANEGLAQDLAGALRDCAAWHGTPKIEIGQTTPVELGEMVLAHL